MAPVLGLCAADVRITDDRSERRLASATTPATRRGASSGPDRYMPRTREPRFGGRDEAGRLRFDAKHDDIYPIVADMIRRGLDLRCRRAERQPPSGQPADRQAAKRLRRSPARSNGRSHR